MLPESPHVHVLRSWSGPVSAPEADEVLSEDRCSGCEEQRTKVGGGDVHRHTGMESERMRTAHAQNIPDAESTLCAPYLHQD